MARLIVDFKGDGIIKTWSKQYSFKCFIVPRDQISTSIDDIDSSNCVYFLVNNKQAKNEKRDIYIGKTNAGMRRFFDHKKKKDFWDKLFLFTSDSDYFDETTIQGLENYLITRYKKSGLYNMNQENSLQKFDDDCEYFGEQIIDVMDFYEYPVIKINREDQKCLIKQDVLKLDINNTSAQNELLIQLEDKLASLSSNIKFDKKKLYTVCMTDNRNLCAVWPYSYGLEIEYWSTLDEIKSFLPNSKAYDISNRLRGNRKVALKIKTIEDLDIAIDVIKYLIVKK